MTLYVPALAAEDVATESTDWLEPPKGTTIEDGLSNAFQPEGGYAEKETLPAKPLTDVTTIFELPKDPFWTVIVDGDVEIEKSEPIPAVKFQVMGLPKPVTRS